MDCSEVLATSLPGQLRDDEEALVLFPGKPKALQGDKLRASEKGGIAVTQDRLIVVGYAEESGKRREDSREHQIQGQLRLYLELTISGFGDLIGRFSDDSDEIAEVTFEGDESALRQTLQACQEHGVAMTKKVVERGPAGDFVGPPLIGAGIVAACWALCALVGWLAAKEAGSTGKVHIIFIPFAWIMSHVPLLVWLIGIGVVALLLFFGYRMNRSDMKRHRDVMEELV